MLALRLVLTDAPPTLVFDEVDAGIGGAAAVAVGRALARLGREHQVLVVTHLPQVAAYADAQVRVAKHTDDDATVSRATVLGQDERVVELSRMLSGQPDSDAARTHAAELLATAAGDRCQSCHNYHVSFESLGARLRSTPATQDRGHSVKTSSGTRPARPDPPPPGP